MTISTAMTIASAPSTPAAQSRARCPGENVLRAGGSVPPYQLLKNAGLDMATPQPYQALNRRMVAIMDEMEALLATRTN